MKYYGLIGFPLSHSFSEKYFTDKFKREGIKDCVYRNFPLDDISSLPQLIAENENLVGLNVTIPYKEKVIQYLTAVDEEIQYIGAVNTIKINRTAKNTEIKGYNTDVYGFRSSIRPYLKEHYRNALILGTGGASKAVAYVLNNLGFQVTYVSRSPKSSDQISYTQVDKKIINEARVIVNTSPVGMYPHIDSCPDIPYEFLTPDHLLYDLIYNPVETRFLAQGRSMGAVTKNGLQMLHLQADKSWKIWNS
jgi:shikimate dehydrogenase